MGRSTKAGAQHIRIDNARVEGDRRHPQRQFLGKGLGQSLYRPFTSAVRCHLWRSRTPPTRAKINYYSPAQGKHMGHKTADHISCALHIHIDYLSKFLGADLPQWRKAIDHPRIVNHQIGNAMPCR